MLGHRLQRLVSRGFWVSLSSSAFGVLCFLDLSLWVSGVDACMRSHQCRTWFNSVTLIMIRFHFSYKSLSVAIFANYCIFITSTF